MGPSNTDSERTYLDRGCGYSTDHDNVNEEASASDDNAPPNMTVGTFTLSNCHEFTKW